MDPHPPPAGPPAPAPYGGAQFPAEAPAPKKKGPSPARVILIVLLGLVVLVGGSCATCTCLGIRSAQRAVDQDAAARLAAPIVSAEALLSAYRADQAAADATYKERWVVVTGVQAGEVKKTLGDTAYVMVGTGKAKEIPEVQCLLRPAHAEKAAGLSKGQPLKVRGKVLGLLLNVVLEACEVLE